MRCFKRALLISKNIFLNSPWFYRIIRFCLGTIFVFSGIVKLIDPKKFARTISQFDLLPEFLLPPVAIGLPLVELLAGLGLIFDVRGSLTAIFSLLIMFIFVLWFGILKGLDIDCGCFSVGELQDHASLREAFQRDLVMIAAVFYLYVWRLVRTNFKTCPNLWAKIKLVL